MTGELLKYTDQTARKGCSTGFLFNLDPLRGHLLILNPHQKQPLSVTLHTRKVILFVLLITFFVGCMGVLDPFQSLRGVFRQLRPPWIRSRVCVLSCLCVCACVNNRLVYNFPHSYCMRHCTRLSLINGAYRFRMLNFPGVD